MESTKVKTTENPALNKGDVMGSCIEEEFVEGFTSDGELTPIDIVAEITGLTEEEIRKSSKIIKVGGSNYP